MAGADEWGEGRDDGGAAGAGGGLRLRSSDDIQGNVLAGFSKDHQVFMFLSFGGARGQDRAQDRAQAGARSWLAELTRPPGGRIATTRQVARFNDRFREERRRLGSQPLGSQPLGRGDPPDLKAVWVNLGLTCSGLLTLHPELERQLDGYEAFRQGASGRRTDEYGDTTTTAALLGDEGDSGPEGWVIGGPAGEPVDALVTVAADREDELLGRVAEERARARRAGLTVLLEQRGDTLPGERRGTEHFGFRDGISQPGVRGFTRAVVRRGREEDADHPGSPVIAAGEFVLGEVGERGHGLAARRRAAPRWMRDGSFQVFRRLLQDVPGWRAEVQRLRGPSMTAEALGAKVVGRWPDGTPLAPARGRRGSNDFDYGDDQEGYHTPRFAHIRKTNPRSDEVFGDRAHRILRRGIPFGPPLDPGAAGDRWAHAERGLLFNAFMASIEDQFEFVQRNWVNNPLFPSVPLDAGRLRDAAVDGHDPLIGVGSHPCVLRGGGQRDRPLDFRRFVRTTGAVYAFAPSLEALRALARPGPLRAHGDLPPRSEPLTWR